MSLDAPRNLLRYNGELITDEPQVQATYSRLWLDFLLGVVELLENPDMWDGRDDVEGALRQVDALRARLLGVEVQPTMGLPGPILFQAMMLHYSSVPTVLLAENACMNNHIIYPVTPADGQVVCSAKVNLPLGDYKLRVWEYWAATSGILRPVLTGAVDLILPAHDTYSASPQLNMLSEYSFTAAELGETEIQITVDGKNPLSGDYYLLIQQIEIHPDWTP